MKKLLIFVMMITLGMAAVAAADGGKCAAKGHGEAKIFKKFDRMDLNGDGSITVEESKALQQVRFIAKDGNSDGSLSEEEFMKRGEKRWKGRHHADDERFAKLREWKTQLFAEADQNGDKKVSRSEFKTVGESRFAQTDGDKDGRISWAEFKAHASEMKERMGK